MRRLLQVRLLFVLIALLLVPAFALPFADRLRTEWARYWEPKAKPIDDSRYDAALALLEELESRNYAQRVQAARAAAWCSETYPTPVLPVGCLFRVTPEESSAAKVDADDFPETEAEATQEAFLRAMEEAEVLSVPFPDEPPIFYKDAAYWERMEAQERERLLGNAP